jgi:hypothetical protein
MSREEEQELQDLRRRYSEEGRGGKKLAGWELRRMQSLEEHQANENRGKPQGGYVPAPVRELVTEEEIDILDPWRRYRTNG